MFGEKKDQRAHRGGRGKGNLGNAQKEWKKFLLQMSFRRAHFQICPMNYMKSEVIILSFIEQQVGEPFVFAFYADVLG